MCSPSGAFTHRARGAPTSKEEEGPCEQKEDGDSEEEAQKPCHPPKHHQDQAERQQNHKGPVHGLEERGGQQAEERYQQPSVNQQTLTDHHLWASPQMLGEKK